MNRVVTQDWLRARADDPSVRVVEVYFATEPPTGSRGIVDGAITAYWKDLLWDANDRRFATADELLSRLSALGIGDDATIVFAGNPTQFGAYALWIFHARGLGDRVLYLDGGAEAWDRPAAGAAEADSEAPAWTPPVQPASADPFVDVVIGRDDVLAALDDPATALIDLRSIEEFTGERVSPPGGFDHGAERGGHIPGARHLHFRDLLHDDGTLRSETELSDLFRDRGVYDAESVITYCRLSHRGSLGWLVLHDVLGLDNVRVYDGSWTEWGSIVGFPVER